MLEFEASFLNIFTIPPREEQIHEPVGCNYGIMAAGLAVPLIGITGDSFGIINTAGSWVGLPAVGIRLFRQSDFVLHRFHAIVNLFSF